MLAHARVFADVTPIEFFSNGVSFWGFEIYYYGIIIALGMCAAMIVCSRLLPAKGLPGDLILDFAVFAIPLGVVGCRLYFLTFPYSNTSWSSYLANWQDFFAIRNGGLGVYGGIIFGYITVFVIARIKKVRFAEVGDTMIPGIMLAQSMGRWGNFFNQEAYGELITNPSLQRFPFAVYIDSANGWYQATFFYESLATLIGFVLCLLLLRNKHYRDGWVLAFYGLYYGTVRLVIESFRSDSLYLLIPNFAKQNFITTNIKISQAVSVICILMGVARLIIAYRKEIAALFTRKERKI